MKPEVALAMRLADVAEVFAIGQVSAVVSNKVTVTVQGGSVTIPRLTTWTPVALDMVLIAKTQAGWIALGKIA
jgi:hypothetical protein